MQIARGDLLPSAVEGRHVKTVSREELDRVTFQEDVVDDSFLYRVGAYATGWLLTRELLRRSGCPSFFAAKLPSLIDASCFDLLSKHNIFIHSERVLLWELPGLGIHGSPCIQMERNCYKRRWHTLGSFKKCSASCGIRARSSATSPLLYVDHTRI